jgi:hypothetical protein
MPVLGTGIHAFYALHEGKVWVPACAGMTWLNLGRSVLVT